VRPAVLGEKVTGAAKRGWDSQEFQNVLESISELTGRSMLDCEQEVMEATKATRSQAANYGVDTIKHLIPAPIAIGVNDEDSESENLETNKAGLGSLAEQSTGQGDKALQLEIIRELNEMVKKGNIDLNTTLSMVMEGIHRGIGIDRVGLCLSLNRGNKKIILGKASIGKVEADWEKKLQFSCDEKNDDHIFSYALRYREPLWMGTKSTLPLANLITPPIEAIIGKGQFFIAPFMAGNNPIGLIYADNRPSQAPLCEESFLAFRLFVKQTSMCLVALRSRR